MNRRQFLQLLALAAIGAGKRTEGMAYKCIGGPVSAQQLSAVGASYWYQWNNGDVGYRQIPNFKGDEVGGPFSLAWTGAASIKSAARKSKWIMVGNEWTLAGWSIEKQVYWLKWFIDQVRSANASCRIIGTNEVIWAKQEWPRTTGFAQVEQVANRYKQLYGTVPPLGGIGFHAYWYNNEYDMAQLMYDYHAKCAQVYRERPGVKLILTEFGSLLNQEQALKGMNALKRLLPYGRIYAYFWFLSYGASYVNRCNLFTSATGAGLTAVGQAYKKL